MTRLLRGLGALLVLIGGLVGLPVALATLGGPPWPADWGTFGRGLLRPDDGTILVGLITAVGWLAWAVFAFSVAVEAAALRRGRRPARRLPGFGGAQRLAASLLIAVVAVTGGPHPVAAEPPPLAPIPVTPAPPEAPAQTPSEDRTDPPAAERNHDAQTPAGQALLRHRVQPGDDLWSLAERYYDDGRAWRRIAAANPDLLTGGPDRLQVGWNLIIPGGQEASSRTDTVTVRRGDTLSAIAHRELGEASRWTELFAANRAVLGDPDELAVGIELVLPGTSDRRPAEAESGQRPAERSSQDGPAGGAAQNQPPEERWRPSVDQAARSGSERPIPRPAPAATAGTASQPAPATPAPAGEPGGSVVASPEAPVLAGVAGLSGLLAAGLITGLALRRRIQLQTRPVGRRIAGAEPDQARLETALGQRQEPLTLHTLDLALRAIALHCLDSPAAVPPLQFAAIGPETLELIMANPVPDAPLGFRVAGRSWWLDRDEVGYLETIPGIDRAVRPYPAMVGLGEDDRGRPVLANLEELGQLALDGDAADAEAVLAAMAVELSFSPWSDEMILTLVGGSGAWADALGKHNVSVADDVDALLDRLAERAARQRDHHSSGPAGRHRVDPDLADPWAPEVVLVAGELTAAQAERLALLLSGEPRPTMAAVGRSLTGTIWRLALGLDPAELSPLRWSLRPQRLDPPVHDAVVGLVAVTGTDQTEPAPWWDGDDPPGPPPDNVTPLGRRSSGWGPRPTEDGSDQTMRPDRGHEPGDRSAHPVLRLLGPIDLLGAAGPVPPRAARQCLEYCGWLLEHPGTTAQAMGNALVVAEGTRRSNMSRLRSWLGEGPDGQPYLPDAYSGRIMLHPSVSSDWHRLQIITAAGVNRTSDDGLRAALSLVRGAPLADAAPGQWHWAEELRIDMISVIRDIGVELAGRALEAGDVDLARWAAARALVAAPGDELLTACRIRTEHRAGNVPETERLTLQLAVQARTLGVDLDPATVELLQQVVEGQVRARMA